MASNEFFDFFSHACRHNLVPPCMKCVEARRELTISVPPSHPEGGWLDRGGRRWFCYCPEKGPNCRPAESCELCEDPSCRTEHNLGLDLDLDDEDIAAIFGAVTEGQEDQHG